MKTILETFICGYDNTCGRLCFSMHKTDITTFQGDPDKALSALLKNIGFNENMDPVCAHSTSWRYEMQKIVLTYLVWTDTRNINTQNRQTLEMEDKSHPLSKGRLSPRPAHISQEDVLRHGLRHLSFLVYRENPFVLEAAIKTGSIDFLKSLEPAPAGKMLKGA